MVAERERALEDLRRDRDALVSALRDLGASINGNVKSFRCPSHDDKTPSAGIYQDESGVQRWKCHACGAGGDFLDVRAEIAGVTAKEYLKANFNGHSGNGQSKKIVATSDYTDENGNHLFQSVRYDDPKDFRQRQPDGKGRWIWNLKGVRRGIPYRLPQLIEAIPNGDTILIVEGEKDCHTAESLGFTATCNAGGAGKWTDEHSECLRGAKLVCIIPDNDDPGLKHGDKVARSLYPIIVKAGDNEADDSGTIKVLKPLGDSKGYDLSDAVADSLTREKLIEKIDTAPAWEPSEEGEIAGSGDIRGDTTPPRGDTTREVIPWQPFPIDVIPEGLRRFVGEVSRAVPCDASSVAVATLTVCAGAIGLSRSIRLKEGYLEPSIFWIVCIGESGTAKTPLLSKAVQPLVEIQSECFARFREEEKDYKAELARFKKTQFKSRSKNRDITEEDVLTEPEPPIAKRSLVSDATWESLAPIMEVGGQKGLTLYSDELASWLDFDRYRGSRKVTGGSQWLSSWSGSAVIVDRRGGDKRTIYIPKPRLSVLGGIQPGTLKRIISEEHQEDGLLARLLLVYPPRVTLRWTEETVLRSTEREYSDLVRRLYELPLDSDESGPCPFIVGLSREAKDLYSRFVNEHASEQDSLTGSLAAAYTKLRSYCARFALVFQTLSDVLDPSQPLGPVSGESMERAITLTRWFIRETHRVYASLDESETERDRRELAEWIGRHGCETTPRNLQNSGPRKYRVSVDVAEGALNDLVEAGLAGRRNNPPSKGGGPGTAVYFLLSDSGDGDTT